MYCPNCGNQQHANGLRCQTCGCRRPGSTLDPAARSSNAGGAWSPTAPATPANLVINTADGTPVLLAGMAAPPWGPYQQVQVNPNPPPPPAPNGAANLNQPPQGQQPPQGFAPPQQQMQQGFVQPQPPGIKTGTVVALVIGTCLAALAFGSYATYALGGAANLHQQGQDNPRDENPSQQNPAQPNTPRTPEHVGGDNPTTPPREQPPFVAPITPSMIPGYATGINPIQPAPTGLRWVATNNVVYVPNNVPFRQVLSSGTVITVIPGQPPVVQPPAAPPAVLVPAPPPPAPSAPPPPAPSAPPPPAPSARPAGVA